MRNISRQEESLADVADELIEVLVALGRRRSLRDPMAMLVAQAELTPPQLHTLGWLERDGALAMGDIARRIGVTEKTMTGVIDRMEREHWVERTRGASDRRVVRVQLTPKGQKKARELNAQMKKSLALFLGLIDPADRRHLLRILHTVVERIAPPKGGDPQEKP